MPVAVIRPDETMQPEVGGSSSPPASSPALSGHPAHHPSGSMAYLLHAVASEWLAAKTFEGCAATTLDRLGSNLGRWLTFLQVRGRTVFGATRQDYRDFENACSRNPDGSDNDATWRNVKSAVKQFHEWLGDEYGVALPFSLTSFVTADRYVRSRVADAGRLSTTTRTVYPLTPPQVVSVLRAARLGDDGQEAPTGRRDVALVSWMLATGMRRGVTSHLTVFEVPALPERGDHVMVHVPMRISKNRRAITRPAFVPRLRAVHQYLHGDRRLVSHTAPAYRPAQPLLMGDADAGRVTITADVLGTGRDLRRPASGAEWRSVNRDDLVV